MKSPSLKSTICNESALGRWGDRFGFRNFICVLEVVGRDITFIAEGFFGVGKNPSQPAKAVASELQAATKSLRRVSLFAIRESLVSYKVV